MRSVKFDLLIRALQLDVIRPFDQVTIIMTNLLYTFSLTVKQNKTVFGFLILHYLPFELNHLYTNSFKSCLNTDVNYYLQYYKFQKLLNHSVVIRKIRSHIVKFSESKMKLIVYNRKCLPDDNGQ